MPLERDFEEGVEVEVEVLMGVVSVVVRGVRPAGESVEGMVGEAVGRLNGRTGWVTE